MIVLFEPSETEKEGVDVVKVLEEFNLFLTLRAGPELELEVALGIEGNDSSVAPIDINYDKDINCYPYVKNILERISSRCPRAASNSFIRNFSLPSS